MREKLIYLDSPYTHKDPAVCEQRFHAVCRHAAEIMRNGYMVFSPIVHTHPIAKYDLPKGWDFWERYNRVFLERCDELWVLKMGGWQESKGVAAKIQIAEQLGIPVQFIG